MSEDNKNSSRSPIRRSYVVAVVIFLVLAAWVASGELNRIKDWTGIDLGGAQKTAAKGAEPKAADAPKTGGQKAVETPTVRVRTISAETRQQDLIIRGQTQALRKVIVRAETSGTVAAIHADKGDVVKEGDTICELNVDARLAMLEQARATMKQRQLEYEASKTLQEKGFRSETSVAGDLAAYQAAKAEVQRMEKEMRNTKIRAPFDGVIDDRMAEVGDFLSTISGACALVVDQDPMLVVGQVSEKDVTLVEIGARGWAKLITGEHVEGQVRFIAKSSDQATRTFRLELEVPNSDGKIRDGVTAEIHIASATVEAHRISPAILALDDNGVIGVRIVEKGNKVRFVPVKIVADNTEGVWVTGLPKTVTIITVGQEYVVNGQIVKTTQEGKDTES